MTTREKIMRLVDVLRETPLEELSTDGRQIAELVQLANGFGFDVFSWIVPSSEAEADVMIDKLIGLAFELRGDDLPPFDPGLYGEAVEE